MFPQLLEAADVVCLSSIFEGLPRTSVQALLARKPFVGTRVDGTPEIIRDGKNGYLVEPKQPSKLAKALEKAIIHKPVDEADLQILLDWSIQTMVAKQDELYQEMLKR